MEDLCRNCDATLQGAFCSACGQPRFRPQDRRFTRLLGDAFEAVTDFDGRLWRSLRAALFAPGRIARDWMEGRRARWISPIRMFLLANLLYFIAPALTDLNLPMHNQVQGTIYREQAPALCDAVETAWKCRGRGQAHSAMTAPALRTTLAKAHAQADARGEAFSLEAFEQRYNARSEAIGKLLVILHVPFMALVLALVAWRNRRFYAEHFVVALGMVAFLLFFVQLLMKPAAWLYVNARHWIGMPDAGMPGFAVAALVLLTLAHFVVACRRCYDSHWWVAVLQGLAAFAALAATTIYVYRPVQFLLSLWTM